MNISQLKTFATVVSRGSFSAAAQELGISQPAVTMQVQALEADLGVTLLDRRYRRVDLTEAGRALLPHAERVIGEVAAARGEIDSLSATISGHLAIAASTTPGVYVIPRLLGGFLSANPEVSVTVEIGDTAEVVQAVEDGGAQLGVCGAVVSGARATFDEVGSDEIVVICSPTSPLAARRAVTFAELSEADWVMREHGSGTRQVAEQALAENGVDAHELRIVAELGSGEAIVTAVEGGLGVGMVSRFAAEKALATGAVALADLVAAPVLRPFYVVVPQGTPTRAAQAFASYVTDSAAAPKGA